MAAALACGRWPSLGGGGLDQAEGAQERPLKAHPADGEVLHCPGGLRSVKYVARYTHLAHAVALDPVLLLCVRHNSTPLAQVECFYLRGSGARVL